MTSLRSGLAHTAVVIHCTVADVDMLASLWDKKPEGWRKAVTTALRPLHKVSKAQRVPRPVTP